MTIYLADSFCRAEQRLVYLEPRFLHDECSNIFLFLFYDENRNIATPSFSHFWMNFFFKWTRRRTEFIDDDERIGGRRIISTTTTTRTFSFSRRKSVENRNVAATIFLTDKTVYI